MDLKTGTEWSGWSGPGRLRSMLLSMVAVLALAGTGCDIGGGGGGGGGASLPTGFPSDFPVYSGASVQTATSPKANKYDVTWTTSEKGGKLFDWYQGKLNSGDYKVSGTAGDAKSGGLLDFAKKSKAGFGGTISLTDGKIHVIMGDGCPCEAPK